MTKRGLREYQLKLLTHREGLAPSPYITYGEKWDFEGADTQYATHSLHTYLAAMIPQLARRLIDMYVPAKGSVLDPFCGGGAVVVEAILGGREAAGLDINDLAILITKAKSTSVPNQQIIEGGEEVLKHALSYEGEIVPFKRSDWVHYWFKPYMLRPLSALRWGVDQLSPGDISILYQIIFSATVRSVMLTHRNEIRLRRMSQEEQAKFNPDVLEKFRAKIKEAAKRVVLLPKGSRAYVIKGSATSLPFRNDEFTSIICSPPYGDERNGVPYTQFARNMLVWLGYHRDDIMKSKQQTLGWYKNGKTAPPSRALDRTLEAIQDNATACKEAIAFYADYYMALKELARVARETIIIVIGQRVLQNRVFDNAMITADLMSSLGVTLETVHYRKLPTKRLPKMREYGAAIDRGNILVFRK